MRDFLRYLFGLTVILDALAVASRVRSNSKRLRVAPSRHPDSVKLESGRKVQDAVILSATPRNVRSPKLDVTAPKPTFFFHVGPHKTGTTFLQNSLCGNSKYTAPLLLQDNLVYLGTCNYLSGKYRKEFVLHAHSSVFEGDRPIDYAFLVQNGFNNYDYPDNQLQFRQDFVSHIERLRPTGHDVLFVYEDSSLFTDKMLDLILQLLSPTWNVKILVIHRTFPDWLLSFHNQLEKTATDWARETQPFDLENNALRSTKIFDAVERNESHPVQAIRNLYARHFGDENVHIARLNDLSALQMENSLGDPLLEYLVCHFVQAVRVCGQVRNGTVTSRSANPYQDFTPILIAQEAFQQGLVPKTAPKEEVIHSISLQMKAKNQTLSNGALPTVCPSQETMDRLKRVSLLVDSNVYGRSDWTHDQETNYLANFLQFDE